jgi:hypothetical protein
MGVQNGCPKSSKKTRKKIQKKIQKIVKKIVRKKVWKRVIKNYKLLKGGWRIVIPMPEAINFVDGRSQKYFFNLKYLRQRCCSHFTFNVFTIIYIVLIQQLICIIFSWWIQIERLIIIIMLFFSVKLLVVKASLSLLLPRGLVTTEKRGVWAAFSTLHTAASGHTLSQQQSLNLDFRAFSKYY